MIFVGTLSNKYPNSTSVEEALDKGIAAYTQAEENKTDISSVSERVTALESGTTETKVKTLTSDDFVSGYITLTDEIRGGSNYPLRRYTPIYFDCTYEEPFSIVGDGVNKWSVRLYDENKTLLYASQQITGSVNSVVTYSGLAAESGVAYARFNLECVDNDVDNLISKFTISRTYTEQMPPFDTSNFALKEDIEIPPLKGCKILNLGDSIAQGGGNDGKSYAHIIAEKYDCTFLSNAVGGATMTDTSINNALNQIAAAIESYQTVDFDFIFLEGGTNDVNTVEVGELLADDNYDYTQCATNTFAGALENAIGTLRNQWATATIIFISVHKMTSRDLEKQKIYHDMAVKCCKKWGIPIADIFAEGQITSYIPSIATTCFPKSETTGTGNDRTHPNDLGYKKFYVPLIEDIMRKYNSFV